MWKIKRERETTTTTISESILIDFEIYGSSNGVFSLAHTQTKDLATGVGCSFLFFSLAFDYYEWTKHNQTTNKQYLNFFSIVILNTIWVIVFCLCVCVWRMRGAIYFQYWTIFITIWLVNANHQQQQQQQVNNTPFFQSTIVCM